jgi:hypothetical protein
MVDVVVDQKPMEKLPYDPNDIPDAVKKRVEAVEALYQNGGNQPPESQPPSGTPTPQAPAQPLVATPAPTPADPADENADSWKHRYLAMQGRYTSATKTIGEMQEQMMQLGNELMHAQQLRPAQPRKATQQSAYLTDQDLENYGAELIDVTQRAALQAVAPKLQEVEQQNADLRKRLAIEARRRLDQAVELSVPNYREIDRNPRWHRWLLGIDVLSGRVRQQLLNEAISAASAPRVISFFRGFLQEEQATGHIEPAPSSQQPAAPREPVIPLASIAAPGRARPATGGDTSVPPDKPIYTRAQIAQLYRAHQKGAYVGREAEWARQDADIIAASREGRIR